MTADEMRAMTAAGPAVVMSSREDFLRLLDERDELKRTVRRLTWCLIITSGVLFWTAIANLVAWVL